MQKSLQLQKIEAAFSETLSLGEAYALNYRVGSVLHGWCSRASTNQFPCLLIHSCLLSETNKALL